MRYTNVMILLLKVSGDALPKNKIKLFSKITREELEFMILTVEFQLRAM